MSPSQVVHLHSHSEYSLLDGACRIDRMAQRAAELDMPALGLTDHGVMNGAVELYKSCHKHGIKPIIGLEAYLVDDRRARGPERYERNHLTLLASSDEGFRNLVKISSAGFLEGFRRGKANVDLELISGHSEGLICLTGCLQSRFCRRLVEDRPGEAREHADQLMQLFGADNVYFEVQANKLADQDKANQQIMRIAGEVGRPLVGTADVHYLRREDYYHHAALLCVQTKSTLAEPKLSFDTNEFYLKSAEEMAEGFAGFPGAVETTLEVAERCNVELELGKILLPTFETPDQSSPTAYLRGLAEHGLERRYGSPAPAAARERLDSELQVIEEMGFDSYFLIVWDFVAFAKREGIAVGPGRGSAAGSIVSYCLEITDVDPLRYDLLFERFLNPARRTMPDMDIDFSVKGRDRVIRYVQERYGEDRVAQIIAFGKMAPRNASRDAARVLGLKYEVGDRIAKLVPEPMQGRNPAFADLLADPKQLKRHDGESDAEWNDRRTVSKQAEPLRALRDSDEEAAKVLEVAQGLEGIVRNNTIHAAGVVIADRPLTELVPVQLAEDRGGEGAVAGERAYRPVTQYSMKPVEEIGLLKMDFLGLRNLDVLEDAAGVIERSRGEQLDLEALSLDDPKTYEMLGQGDSVGVFQFESDGMRDALRKVKPTEFDDLVALVALFRPGPMRFIPDYAKAKRDPSSVTYIDPRLKAITGKTYGIPIYQEQLMEIAKQIAGFPGPEADELRRAIGKKERKLMGSMEKRFMTGCKSSGTNERVARELWSLMEAAADYSFNRSHAACYALIAYRTAYLKANYPVEYMAALISTVMGTKDKVPFFVNRCVEMGIEVLPPDVNASAHDFVVVEGSIRFGLDAVKNVGHQAVDRIVAAREQDGPFGSIWDFCARVDSRAVNKRALESLVKCGALDSTGDSRRGMLEVLPHALGAGQRAQQDAQSGQGSIFEMGGSEQAGGGLAAPSHPPVPAAEFEREELLRLEQETLGYFVSEHPLTAVREALRARCDCTLPELVNRPDGSWVTVGGLITQVKRIRTKAGDPMMFATLDDLQAQVEMLIFNSAYASNEGKVEPNQIVTVRGRVDHKERGETKLVAQEVERFEAGSGGAQSAPAGRARRAAGPLRLRIDAAALQRSIIEELRSIFEHFPGEAEVELEMVTQAGPRRLRFGPEYKVAPTSQLQAEIDSLLGPGALVQ